MEKALIINEVKSILRHLAPEVDSDSVDNKSDLRKEYEIDSMDFNNFIIGLHEKFGIDIPEKDYQKLSSIDEIVNYIEVKQNNRELQ